MPFSWLLMPLLFGFPLWAMALSEITTLRLSKGETDNVRVIFEVSAPLQHEIFTLNEPHRLVIDLKNSRLVANLPTPAKTHGILQSIRSAERNQSDVRIVLDLKTAVRVQSFVLQPSGNVGHRLVIDLNRLQSAPPAGFPLRPQHKPAPVITSAPRPAPAPIVQRATVAPTPISLPATPQTPLPAAPSAGKRDLIIAIDAGHGGVDPGAIGKGGTKEKDVVLAISQELANLVARERGMRPILIRSGDYFLKLRTRIDLARQYKADIFLSIHADADPNNGQARGSSVYILSQGAASNEAARWLAEKENGADLIGGVSINNKNDLLASVLLDLSQAGTLEASTHLAQQVLNALAATDRNHLPRVQRAGFMVLRSPDIPSILIETAFISNPADEQKLNDSAYRQQVAQAILQGIKSYLIKYAPTDTLVARR